MNCTRCQHELSQCLDGRLGSGRRAVVMRHAAGCELCAEFWADLQKAQVLVLNLPPEQVSPGFRAQLWERLKAGEGTPEAVFREPVPMAAKVRYVLSGAAAAAAVLFVLYSWMPERTPMRDSDPVASVGQPGGQTPTPPAKVAADEGRLRARDGNTAPRSVYVDQGYRPDAMFAGPQPLTPALVANEAAHNFTMNYAIASDHLGRLRSDDDQMLKLAVRRICDSAAEMKCLGDVLLDLQTDGHVVLSQTVDKELRFVTALLDENRLRREHSLAAVQTMVAPVFRKVSHLRELPRRMTVRSGFQADEREDFLRKWAIRAAEHPELMDSLFVQFAPHVEVEPFEFQALQGNVFLLQTECGSDLVVPRSSVQMQTQDTMIRILGSYGRTQVQLQVVHEQSAGDGAESGAAVFKIVRTGEK